MGDSINEDTYNILLLGTGDAHYDKELCEILLEFKNAFSDQNHKNIVVNYRSHPFSRKKLKDFWSQAPEGLKIIPSSGGDFDTQLSGSILASDLVVTLYSTTVLDALILDKLVLIPGFIGESNAINSIDFIHNSWFRGLENYLLLAKSKEHFYSIICDLTISNDKINNKELFSNSWAVSDVINYYICNKNFYESIEELVQNIESGINVKKI
jgi:CDP-glycerol glycerophosphotransferase (TagB/SpsB family)